MNFKSSIIALSFLLFTSVTAFADFLIRMIENGKLGAGKIKAWHNKFYNE